MASRKSSFAANLRKAMSSSRGSTVACVAADDKATPAMATTSQLPQELGQSSQTVTEQASAADGQKQQAHAPTAFAAPAPVTQHTATAAPATAEPAGHTATAAPATSHASTAAPAAATAAAPAIQHSAAVAPENLLQDSLAADASKAEFAGLVQTFCSNAHLLNARGHITGAVQMLKGPVRLLRSRLGPESPYYLQLFNVLRDLVPQLLPEPDPEVGIYHWDQAGQHVVFMYFHPDGAVCATATCPSLDLAGKLHRAREYAQAAEVLQQHYTDRVQHASKHDQHAKDIKEMLVACQQALRDPAVAQLPSQQLNVHQHHWQPVPLTQQQAHAPSAAPTVHTSSGTARGTSQTQQSSTHRGSSNLANSASEPMGNRQLVDGVCAAAQCMVHQGDVSGAVQLLKDSLKRLPDQLAGPDDDGLASRISRPLLSLLPRLPAPDPELLVIQQQDKGQIIQRLYLLPKGCTGDDCEVLQLGLELKQTGQCEEAVRVLQTHYTDWVQRAGAGNQHAAAVFRLLLSCHNGSYETEPRRLLPLLQQRVAFLQQQGSSPQRDEQLMACLETLGRDHLVAGDCRPAAATFAQLQPLAKRVLGEAEPRYHLMVIDRAVCMMQLREFAKATSLLTSMLHTQRTQLGARHPSTVRTAILLGQSFSAAHRYEDAEKVYKTVWEDAIAVLGVDDHQFFILLKKYHITLVRQGKHAQDEQLVLAAWAAGLDAERYHEVMDEHDRRAEGHTVKFMNL